MTPTRAEFERARYCLECGRRLEYYQYRVGDDQIMRKACSEGHVEYEHIVAFPNRTKRGTLTDGSRRIKREVAG